MNRRQRRAAKLKPQQAKDRDAAIDLAMQCLASATKTATGATLLLPSGETIYLDAADARGMVGAWPTRGRA